MLKLFKLLISLSLVAIISTSNVERVARDLQSNALTFRLAGTVKPSVYTVVLFIDPNNRDSFSGGVTIRFRPDTQTNILALHALDISVHSVTLMPVGLTQQIGVSENLVDDSRQFLRVTTSSLLSPESEYDITITYIGQYADNMFGVYFSSYLGTDGTTNYLVATQFQPTFARRAFPCFDEPHLKAVFRVSIYAPQEFTTVLANTEEIDNTGRLPQLPGFVLHEFADTVEMSTYLVAFVVSNFVSIGNSDAGEELIYDVPFRVFTRAGGEESARFALEFGQQSMVALEEYTEMEYAFQKLDKVGLPDFAAGAMENWGLVTYREIALLYVDGVTTTINLQNIGRLISHENMHMWFGNEVSPAWWNYLWLNEGFANLFEHYATDMVRPGWRMMDQYVVSTVQTVFQNDAVKNVNPMTTDVFTPTEVLGNFNAVAYQKSGSVIRMLQHVMTPELFRQGLVNYLRIHVRGVATAADLYDSLQPYSPVNVSSFMNNWVNNPGFPVLTITRDAPNANSVTIFQHRYYTDPSIVERGFWTVPLNWVLSGDPDFTDTSPQDWLPVMWLHSLSLDMPGLSGSEWYIFNKQQTGYYRVNYDEQNWINLGIQLNSDEYNVIHFLNRAQLVDDSVNLARTERLSYAIAFDIVKYLIQEPDYIPWQSGFNAFTFLHNTLADTEAFELFQNFVMEISEPIYDLLGFTIPDEEEHVAKFHRNIAINMQCRYGNQNCLNEASELLESLIDGEIDTIHPDLQIVVFCSALRAGSSDHFNFLWTKYLAATESAEEIVLLNALGCTSNEDDLVTYMNQAIDPDSEVRLQDRHTIINSVINSGVVNAERAFNFVLENFQQLQDNVQGFTGTSSIIQALAVVLHTEEHLNKFEEFAAAHQGSLSASEESGIALALETIATTIAWRNENVPEIQSWLKTHFGLDIEEEDDDGNGAAPVVATAMFVLVALLATVFNM